MSDQPRLLRVALTQLTPTTDVAANLAQAVGVVREASTASADLVLLPENCLAIGSNEEMRASALRIDSPEIDALREAAVQAGTTVVLGGFKRVAPDGRIFNTALVIAPDGSIAGGYDKVHLFNASVGGTVYAASSVETAGSHPVIVTVGGVRVGITICYDVRFPELHRRLAAAGAEVLLVPAAFTVTTGLAHWEVLLRSRAIENGAFVMASATVGGPGSSSFPTYGHALAVDPWGRVLADLGEQDHAWQMIELDLMDVENARRALPVLHGVRPDAYAAEVETIVVDAGRQKVRSA